MNSTVPTVLTLSLLALACSKSSSSSPPPSPGVLSVLATDSFLSHNKVEEARIDLTAIRVNSGQGLETIHDGPVLEVVLTDLQGGKVADLASEGLPDGIYHEVELEVSGGYLRLTSGKEFSTDLGNMTLCSGSEMTTISPVITISGSPGSTLLLDFDLTKSFSSVPEGNTLEATSFELCPHLRAVELEGTGELRGTVTAQQNGQTVLIDKADVIVLPGGEKPGNALTTTGTTGGGVWAAIGLEPGRYDVLVESGNLRGFVAGLTVTAGQATTIEIEVE